MLSTILIVIFIIITFEYPNERLKKGFLKADGRFWGPGVFPGTPDIWVHG